MKPISATITEIIDETPSIKTFRLDTSSWLKARPGQFVMVWIRGVDEVPMTLSYDNAITVQKVGEATEALFNCRSGTRWESGAHTAMAGNWSAMIFSSYPAA